MTFLPLNPHEINQQMDFILIIPEAYVDHPSFGHAIVSRIVQSKGFNIAINSQPKSDADFTKFGIPKIAFMVSGGVVDSMVSNYTVAKQRRTIDEYSEGGKAGNRPDYAVTAYCQALKRLYPHIPIIIGGIEASLRRFSHYDYWSDKVMPSILLGSKADLLIYGMGENPLWEILDLIKKGVKISDIKHIKGTAYLSSYDDLDNRTKDDFNNGSFVFCPSHEEVLDNKIQYVKAFNIQFSNSNAISAKGIAQRTGKDYVVQNPPALPLTQQEMDSVYNLPYMRTYHPSYKAGVPAIEEVKFSITSHRGCFGSCAYCALSYHQGRNISSRTKESIVDEAKKLVKMDDFKGYIHDVGGPTANFRQPSCNKQLKHGVCKDKMCIGYTPCKHLKVDHSEYLDILRAVRDIDGIKKVFIRSGIRFDYLMMDKDNTFFTELVAHHISGQLKVAPEHSATNVLRLMNKPKFDVYKRFSARFKAENAKLNKKQYLVPYLISSHPGCTLKDAIELTEYLKSIGYMPQQVQDFYPTPSTKSTCMYYTGINPDTMEDIFVARAAYDKKMQRALLQYRLKENLPIIREAYAKANLPNHNYKPPRIHKYKGGK